MIARRNTAFTSSPRTGQMIISHRHRFILLKPWKAASSTLHARLSGYCRSPYGEFYEFNPHLNRVVHQHLVYADFAALPESRLGYFTAAFVRNPYDRVYSGFRQLQKDYENQPLMQFADQSVRRLVMAQLSENFSALCRAGFSFEAWLESLDEYLVREVGRNSSFPLHPAHYWTHHGEKQAVDFIGRVESFERDFERMCERVGIEVNGHENQNVDARADELEGDEHGYRYAARMSPAARARINELFERDFELLGYERVS